MAIKYFLCLSGLLLSVPLLPLIALAFTLPVTISWVCYLLAFSLVVAGLISAPWRPKLFSRLTAVGVLAVILIAGARISLGRQNAASDPGMVTLPQGGTAHWISYIVDEQDSLLLGESLFHLLGGDSNREHAGLAPALASVYSEMRAGGVFPSPIPGTYLNLQGPDRFDTVVIEPEDQGQPGFGVIFLHGYMGNVSAQCWVIAQAAKKVGGLTVCPSTGWRGEWWQPPGQAILQETFDYLREHGIQRIYLGGYSNGGFGIGRSASGVAKREGLNGLFFIDGFAEGRSIRAMGLPVLIVQGTLDERVPVVHARQFADELGGLGTYVELDADHFLIMKQPGLVRDALAKWLEDLQSGR